MASSSSIFNFPTPSTTPAAPSPFTPFQSQQQQQQQQQPQQPQQQPGHPGQLNLFTKDGTPVSYNTKWSDIHPDSQRLLQSIEERILEYRDESWRLDQCERLYDTTALNKGFELDAARISQELSGVGIAIEREQASLQDLMKAAKDMLRNAEIAVRSFMMLCLRYPRSSAMTTTSAGGATPPTTGSGAIHVSDFYSGVPVKPSPFLQQTVAKFETKLVEYRQWVEELERLLLRNDKGNQGGSELSLLQSLPTVMGNLHDFFIYVAAEVESLHEFLENMRIAFLADQRRRGDDNDPFLEADRREVAKREAAAKRVHPSALKPSELNTQTPGLTSSTPSLSFASSGGAFATPGVGLPSGSTQSSSAFPSISPTSSIFGSTPLFGTTPSTMTAQSPPLFAPSAPSTATTPSILGSSVPNTVNPIFGTGSTTGTAAVRGKNRVSTRRK